MKRSSSEEETTEAKVDDGPTRRKSSLTFHVVNPFSHKSRSSSTIHTQKEPVTPSCEHEDSHAIHEKSTRALVRSKSTDVGARAKKAWGDGISEADTFKASAETLRNSVAEYSKEATIHQWTDLVKINADIGELGKVLETSQRKKRSKMGHDGETADGVPKFSAVALEYSKMLDVVMNQSPEYAGLAWGVIRMLLVAHTNNSKLKHAVEHYLIQFGKDLGIVNSLMNAHPTQKMLEAVIDCYSAFSIFLAKVIGFYKESKLQSAFKALGFPWETKFETHVNKIKESLQRIKEIASAGHLGMALQTRNMVENIETGQESLRQQMHLSTFSLRQQVKLDMKEEVQKLFDDFDRNWISRFEQIMLESTRSHMAVPAATADERALPAGSSHAAIDSVGSTPQEGPSHTFVKPATYLADCVLKAKRLRKFRDKCFPLLQDTDNDTNVVNMKLRHLATNDLQQIMGLFRQEAVREWLQSGTSSFIWINTFRRSSRADWATGFAAKLIEFGSKSDKIIILDYLCGTHPTNNPVSTATVLLQSIIMQLIQYHHKKFVRKVSPFTLEYFTQIRDSVGHLWDLFHRACDEVDAPCVWLIIDNIDNLQQREDYDTLLDGLQSLIDHQSRMFKLCMTARAHGTPTSVLEAMDEEPNASRIRVVNVAKAQSSASAALMAKRRRRRSRLPDAQTDHVRASPADLQALLDSSSDNLLSSDDAHPNGLATSPQPISPNLPTAHLDHLDTQTDASDSAFEFTRHTAFVSSESEIEAADQSTEENSEDETMSFVQNTTKPKSSSSSSSSSLPESAVASSTDGASSREVSPGATVPARGQEHGVKRQTPAPRKPLV